jgi:hypothetical protein
MRTALSMTVATVLAMLAASAIAQQTIGVIKRSSGQVALERSGVQVAPAPGAEVFRGDRVITGRDGYVNISMRRAAPITVGPESNVALDRFAADAQPVVKRPAPAILQGLASFLAVNRQQ